MQKPRRLRTALILLWSAAIVLTGGTTSQAAPLKPVGLSDYIGRGFLIEVSVGQNANTARLRVATSPEPLDIPGVTEIKQGDAAIRSSTAAQERVIAQRNADQGITFSSNNNDARVSKANITASKAKIDYDYITHDECLKNPASFTDIGWTKNHYSWCKVDDVLLGKYRMGVGSVASLSYRSIMIGRGNRKSRTMLIDQYNENMVTTGQWAGGVDWQVQIPCAGSPTYKQCIVEGGRKQRVITGSSFEVSYKYWSYQTGTQGEDNIGTGVIRPFHYAIDPQVTASVAGLTQGFRCDTATYVDYGKACIYDRVQGTFHLDRADSKLGEAAKHVWAAQNTPAVTYPRVPGKTMPLTLHRIFFDKSTQRRNHAQAVKTCKSHWGKYDTKKYDCDEYPFKSTLEGAARGDNRYSARVISLGDNRSEGSRLGHWYQSDHVIDGDGFIVFVK